jgi:GNAT superfamily N-acetyltransferase
VTVTIRPAAPGDAEAISAVHIRARLQAYAEIMSPQALALMNTQVTPRRWAARLHPSAERGWGLVAVEDDSVIGFVFVCPSGEGLPGVGDVEALHIDPAHQGTGVGRRLHDAALALLADEGLTSYVLWVLEGNTRAIGFYLRQGWRPDGRRLRDVGGDFLRFVR